MKERVLEVTGISKNILYKIRRELDAFRKWLFIVQDSTKNTEKKKSTNSSVDTIICVKLQMIVL